MSAFAFVLIAMSILLGIALADLLSGAARLIIDRKRVKGSAILFTWLTFAVGLLLEYWLSLWQARGVAHWDIDVIASLLLYATFVYLIGALAMPRPNDAGSIDMVEHHRAHGGWLFALAAGLAVAGLYVNLRLGIFTWHDPWMYLSAAMLVAAVSGAATRSEGARSAALGVIVLTFLIWSYSTISGIG